MFSQQTFLSLVNSPRRHLISVLKHFLQAYILGMIVTKIYFCALLVLFCFFSLCLNKAVEFSFSSFIFIILFRWELVMLHKAVWPPSESARESDGLRRRERERVESDIELSSAGASDGNDR